ncbi:hypothetical protein [Mailhella sp.]|uniref:hypothetical protein n=1 Tax=Mailhella sp. TaxID=1981029 RepID=UPI0040634386
MSHDMYLHKITSSTPSRVEDGSALAAERTLSSADRESVERFNKAMDGEGAYTGSYCGTDGEPFSQSLDSAHPQDASSLFGMHGSFGAMFAESVEQDAALPALSGPELDMLVEHILASRPDDSGAEVRLFLGGEMLKGTEIVIRRDSLGLLSVQLHAHEAAAFQTLVASRNDLADALERFESNAVRVTIEYGGDSDAERRSRGLFLYDSFEA